MTVPLLRFGAGDGAKVDLAKLHESRLLIQGVSGSGKSTLIRSILEQTYGTIPHLVVDFDGDFVTLREKYDYVLVGPGGDVPIATKTAKITIRRLSELGVSAIFDISDMKFPERREWVRLACEELVHLPEAADREALAESAGVSPTSSGYANNLGALRSLGLIDYRTGKQIVATGLLFPPGLV